MSRTRDPRWVRSSPRIDADRQVGHNDPGGRTDRINAAVKQIWAELQRIARDLYVDPALDGNGAGRLTGPLQPWVQYDGLRRQGGAITNHGGFRYGGVYVSDGTYLYSLGGRTGAGGVTDSVDRYDPIQDTWEVGFQTLPAAGPRELFGAVHYQGKIYVWGGLDSGGSVVAGTHVYTIATDSWSTLGNGLSRYGFGFCFARSATDIPYLIHCGGHDGTSATDDCARMDLSSLVPTWELLPNALSQMPAARVHPVAVWDPQSARVYVVGGDDTGGTATNTNYVFDFQIAIPEWDTATVLPATRRSMSGALVRGKVVLTGGSTGTSVQTTTFVYDPLQDSWTGSAWDVDDLPTAVDRAMMVFAEGSLFLIGGRTNVSTGAASNQHIVCAIGPKLFTAPHAGVYTTIERRSLTDAVTTGNTRGLVNLTRGYKGGSVGAFEGDEIGHGVVPDYSWNTGANAYVKVVG